MVHDIQATQRICYKSSTCTQHIEARLEFQYSKKGKNNWNPVIQEMVISVLDALQDTPLHPDVTEWWRAALLQGVFPGLINYSSVLMA